MPNIIAILKHRRESLGLSLLEIQDKIRINAKFIEAIEKGDFDALPNPLYIKIFLRSYAKFLGLDVPEIMALYEEQAAPKPSDETIYRTKKKTSTIRFTDVQLAQNKIFLRVLVAIGIIVVLIAIFWKILSKPNTSYNVPVETTVPVSETPEYVSDKLLLSVEVIDATWLQLIVDDNAPIEMVLNAGDKKEWYSNNKFILWIGNPAGATFFLNKKRIFIPEEKKGKVIKELVLSKELLSGKEEVINPYGK